MGRLIDVDEVKIAIYHAFAPYQREWAETLLKVNNAIDSTKTAYNPEAVVYELEKNSHGYTTVSDLGISSVGRKVYLKDAIEIVREGGVKRR